MSLSLTRKLLLFIIVASSFTVHATCSENKFPFTENELSLAGEKVTEGWNAYLGGKVAEAKKLFEAASKENRKNHYACFGMETVLNSYGDYEEAYTVIIKAIEVCEDNEWLELYIEDALSLLEIVKENDLLEKVLRKKISYKSLPESLKTNLKIFLAEVLMKSGKTLDADNISSELNFLRDWLVLGPFNNREKSGFEKSLPLEDILPAIEHEKEFEGRQGKIKWFKPQTLAANGYLDISSLLYPEDENLAYAATQFKIAKPSEAEITFGSAGAAAIWVNGIKIAAWDTYHTYHPLQRKFQINLKEGVNQIAVKIAGERNKPCGFSLLLNLFEKDNKYTIDLDADLKKDNLLIDNNIKYNDDYGLDWGMMKKLRENNENAFSLSTLGYFYLKRNLDNSLSNRTRPLFEKSVSLCENCPLFLELCSLVQKDANKSKELLEKAIQINPQETAAKELLAEREYYGGFTRKAEKLCREILQNQKSFQAHNTLANIYKDKNWPEDAYQQYKAASSLAPRRIILYRNIAETSLSEKQKVSAFEEGFKKTGAAVISQQLIDLLLKNKSANDRKLEKIITDNIKINPFNKNNHLQLTEFFLSRNETKKAQDAVAKGLNYLPFSPELLEYYGRLYLLSGNKEKCIELWNQSLALNHDNPQLRKYLEEIEPHKKTFYDKYIANMDDIIKLKVNPDDYPDYNTAVLFDQGISRANPNGTKDMYIHFVRQALRTQGAEELRSYTISYDPSREKIKVLSAKVYQPDGSVISSKKIKDVSRKGGGGEGVIYDMRHGINISFPQVKDGSVVELKYVNESTGKNVYGDHFEDIFFIGGNNPTEKFNYIIIAPENLGVNVATFHEKESNVKRIESEKDGNKIWNFSAEKISGFQMEPAMPPFQEFAPSIRASSFKSWDDVGLWYWGISKDSFELPKDISEEIHELVNNLKTPEEKIEAIYYKVIDKVRYVGIELGRNGYIPHQAERTYRTSYGDCKDTAVLLCSMLKVAGIKANVALVRTWNMGKEPTGLPGANRFNHAICYVPEIDGKEYWLDGTTDYNHFTELPVMDQGAIALITGEEGGKFVTIPEDDASKNSEHISCDINVNEDRSATIKTIINFSGAYASSYRRIFEAPERFNKMLEMFLQRRFPGAKLTEFKTSSPSLKEKETYFSFIIAVPEFAVSNGETLKVKTAILPQGLAKLAFQNDRKNDLILGIKRTHKVDIKISFATKGEINYIPQDINIAQPFGIFNRKTDSTANTISIVSETTIPLRKIKLAQYQEFKKFCNRVDSAEEEWIVFKPE